MNAQSFEVRKVGAHAARAAGRLTAMCALSLLMVCGGSALAQDQQPPDKSPPNKTTPNKTTPPSTPPANQKQGEQKQDEKKQDGKTDGQKKQDDKKSDDKKTDGTQQDADKQKQLDKDLFDDLGGGLFDKVDKPKTDGQQKSDGDLFDDLGDADGEDVGTGGDPLIRIGERMRKVESLLNNARSGTDTQELQQRITADLDKLIAQAEQQQQQQSQNSQNNQSSQNDQNSQANSSSQNTKPTGDQPQNQNQAQASQTPGETQSRDSSPEARPAGPDSASMAGIRDLMEKTPWGDLPARIRETMLQSPQEQMLPEFAEQIREYFKQLAKRRGN